jgi:hypothetical protein
MRRTFKYGVEIDGLGEVVGSYAAENGAVEEITLPDGEVVEISPTSGPYHKDQLIVLLSRKVVNHIERQHWWELDQTRRSVDWKGYAPNVL